MTRKLLCASSIVILFCAVVLPAGASIVYQYTGNTFTNVVDPGNALPSGISAITGNLTLASPLPGGFSGPITALSFSFTDGATTIDNTNTSHFDATLVTNPSGNLIDWVIEGWIETPGGVTEFFIDSALPGVVAGDKTSYFGGTSFASTDAVGSFTAPEPSSLLLLGVGLAVLSSGIWRLKRRVMGSV